MFRGRGFVPSLRSSATAAQDSVPDARRGFQTERWAERRGFGQAGSLPCGGGHCVLISIRRGLAFVAFGSTTRSTPFVSLAEIRS